MEQPVLYEGEVALYAAQLHAQREEQLREASVFTSTLTAEIVDEPFNCRKLLERCSTLQTVRGVITRVRRFIVLLKSRVRHGAVPNMTGPLTVHEVNYADLLLCRATQQQLLAKEVIALREDKKLPKGSVLRNLPVYLDTDTDVIRLKTRLHKASSLTFDYTNPIICLLYTSPSPRDLSTSRMPSSA